VVFRVRRWREVGTESEGRMSVEGKRKKDERSVRTCRAFPWNREREGVKCCINKEGNVAVTRIALKDHK
jgi:hypothetical protein